MVCGDECGGGHRGVLVDNASFNESLDGLHSGGVDDTAEGADCVWSVHNVAANGGVFHDGGGDHNNIVGRACELLDDQVDHLAKRSILVLEELRNAKEESGGFLSSPALASEEQQSQLG